MPAKPTWDQVADIARQIDTDDMAGICLRGKPGWGDLGASFTTVLNTFGGTWWSANADGSIGEAQVDQPEFKEALQFYVDLLADAGEDDAANASYNECSAQYRDGKVAMWYDATVAAGSFEADDSPVKGLNGYALAPVKLTDASGWLWSWALAIPTTTPDPDLAWQYVSWATGPGYLAEAGDLIPGGWAAIPPGTRRSTYEIPQYQEAAAAFADQTLAAMDAAPIDNPGTTPRPGMPGVQYVGVPEFQDVGNRCTEQFSGVIAGRVDIDDALQRLPGHRLAGRAADATASSPPVGEMNAGTAVAGRASSAAGPAGDARRKELQPPVASATAAAAGARVHRHRHAGAVRDEHLVQPHRLEDRPADATEVRRPGELHEAGVGPVLPGCGLGHAS